MNKLTLYDIIISALTCFKLNKAVFLKSQPVKNRQQIREHIGLISTNYNPFRNS